MKYFKKFIITSVKPISAIILFFAINHFAIAENQQNDIDILYHRLYKQSLLPDNNDNKVDSIIMQLNPNGSFNDVDYLEESPDKRISSGIASKKAEHLRRLHSLANAYNTISSKFYHNEQLKLKIFSGMHYWIELNLVSANWWWRNIGYPEAFSPICILMKEEMQNGNKVLLNEAFEYLFWSWKYPKSNSTGANGINVARLTIAAALIVVDVKIIEAVMARVVDLLAVIGKNPEIHNNDDMSDINNPNRGGVQADFTFTQHNGHGRQLYWGGYGSDYLDGFTFFNNLTEGTRLRFNTDIIADMEDIYLEGLQWFIYKGTIDYHHRGRHIYRNNASGFIAPLEEFIATNPPRKEELSKVLERWKSPKEPVNNLVGNKFFWRCDYMVHQQPGYFVSYRMSTTRTTGNEAGLGEGYSNLHTGDGVHYILKDGDEYEELIKHWNWQRLPGVTCRQSNDDIAIIPFWGEYGDGDNPFGGGTTNGKTGMSGYKFDKLGVYATKSIFFMDDYFVVLAADIHTGPKVGAPLHTTLNQTWKKGDIWMKKEGKVTSVKSSASAEAPDWIFHDNTAYFFLNNKTMNQDKVSVGIVTSSELKSQQIFDVGIDHGSRPVNARFAYAIAPLISLEETKNISLPIQIISNTSVLQAIYNTKTSIAYISYFEPGKIDLPNNITLASADPCVVIMETKGNQLIFSVANPKGESDDIEAINLSINRNVAGERVVYNKQTNSSVIRFPLPQKTYSGKNVTKAFTLN